MPTPITAFSPIPAGSRWLLRSVLQLGLLLGILLVLAHGVVSWLAAEAFEDHLLPEVNRQVQLAGELVASQIGNAVALGIPVDRLVGVNEFFDEVFTQSPSIQQLTVLAVDGEQVLYNRFASYASGTNIADLQRVQLPILADGATVAQLVVEYEGYSAASQLAALRSDRATIVVAAWLAGSVMLLVFAWSRVRDPLQVAADVLTAGARNNFTYTVGYQQAGEVRLFAKRFNEAVHRVNTDFDEFAAEAEEASAAQLDRKERERISDLVTGLQKRFTFAPPLQSIRRQLSSPRSAWIPVFLFLLAQEMWRPFLAVALTSAPAGMNGFGNAEVISSQLLAATAIVFVTGRWFRTGDPRVFFICGIIITVVSLYGFAFGGELAPLWFWAVLSGLGWGAVLFAALVAEIWQPQEHDTAIDGLLTLVGTGVAAIASGGALGGVLVGRLGLEVALWVAIGVTSLSAVLALSLLNPVTRMHFRSIEEMHSGEGDVTSHPTAARPMQFSTPPLLVWQAGCIAASLTGWAYYLMPHLLVANSLELSMIGRMLLVYGATAWLMLRLLGAVPHRILRPRYLIWISTLAASLGCMLSSIASSEVAGLFLGAILMGLGHGVGGWLVTQSLFATTVNFNQHGVIESRQPAAQLLVMSLGFATGGILVASLMREVLGVPVAILAFGGLLPLFAVVMRRELRGAAAPRRAS